MNLVSIQANTDVLKKQFIEHAEEMLQKLKDGEVQLAFIGILDENGTTYKHDFTNKPGPSLFRLMGFIEYIKALLIGEAI